MKIVFTGDNHVYFNDQRKAVTHMMEAIRKEKPDIVCIAGDIGEILMYDDLSIVQKLFSIKPTLFVLGNHDLYSEEKYTPPQAMDKCLNILQWGTPLQNSWSDTKTVYEQDECLFLGTTGFPCFSHPKMIMPINYYDDNCPTIDGTYINLNGGWLQYTRPLMKAFEKKLQLVDKSTCKNVIIISHYPCYESQYKLNPSDDISVYFYNYKLGLMIKKMAKKHPEKKFYSFACHGHEYMVGQWIQETPNLTTYGLVTAYNKQNYTTLEL